MTLMYVQPFIYFIRLHRESKSICIQSGFYIVGLNFYFSEELLTFASVFFCLDHVVLKFDFFDFIVFLVFYQ